MPWLRFDRTRGINMDECTEWSYEDRVVAPLRSWWKEDASLDGTPSQAMASKETPSGDTTAAGSSATVSARASRQSAPKPVDETAAPAVVTPEVAATPVADASPSGEVLVPVVVAEDVPPVTIPTLHLLMRDGREVTLEGEQAAKARAFLVASTGSV